MLRTFLDTPLPVRCAFKFTLSDESLLKGLDQSPLRQEAEHTTALTSQIACVNESSPD